MPKYLKKYKQEVEMISNQLMKTAMADSILQEEELHLVDQIVTDIQGFAIFLNRGKLKEQTKEEFHEELSAYRDKIMKNAQYRSTLIEQSSDNTNEIIQTLYTILQSSSLFAEIKKN